MAKENSDVMELLMQEVFNDKDALRGVVELLVNQAMQLQVERHVGAEPHERTNVRRGYRNGTKPRRLQTRVGSLDLTVPQVRGCEPYHPTMFSRWQRSERALLVSCAEMYFQGVSTRNVQEVLEVMCGGEISSSVVSRVAAELDEKLATFRCRRLDKQVYPYLKIDARYEKVRIDGHVVSQAVLITAGFTGEGKREILDWRVDDSESQATWGEVFRQLKDRGLQGVRMVVSDAHGGIRKALARHFQGVAWQRCQVHFKRELLTKVAYKRRGALMDEIRVVLRGADLGECLRRGEELAARWEARYPKVARMVREGLEDCLAVLSLPQSHRIRMASTNMLENLMRRLKKRTRVVGVFPNRASCHRLIGALLLEVHEAWAVDEKIYFNMELLHPTSEAGSDESAAA